MAATVTGVSSRMPDGTYNTGEFIDLYVQFSEYVAVTGTPRLLLETGATDRYATYISADANQVFFRYVIQSDDASTDMDYVGVDSLELNGGTIKDMAGVPANITLPLPGNSGSLAANKNFVINVNYTRGDYDSLPINNDNLKITYTLSDVAKVAADDTDMVAQAAPASYYMVHQFKMLVLGNKVTPVYHGQSSVNCATKAMYLQIYHRTNGWETLASDTTTVAGTHITLTYADKDVSTGYKDADNIVSFRVQQQAPAV